MQQSLIALCVFRLISGREHHVSDYLLAGIERCGYKDQACFFIAYHDDSGWCGCSCNHGVYCGYYGQYGDCLSHTASMLWGDWRVCTFETLCLPLAKGVFSKTYLQQSLRPLRFPLQGTETFLTLKEGSSKIIPSFFTIKEGSTFLTKPLFPQGREDVTALLGARNRFALRLADHQRSSPDCAGWDRLTIAC